MIFREQWEKEKILFTSREIPFNIAIKYFYKIFLLEIRVEVRIKHEAVSAGEGLHHHIESRIITSLKWNHNESYWSQVLVRFA